MLPLDIWFIIKGIILTEVFTNAARSWGIFDKPRQAVKAKYSFFRLLLDCFECTSVWAATFTVIYLSFFEFEPFTFLLIFHRLACFLHVGFDYLDACRAVKEKEV